MRREPRRREVVAVLGQQRIELVLLKVDPVALAAQIKAAAHAVVLDIREPRSA